MNTLTKFALGTGALIAVGGGIALAVRGRGVDPDAPPIEQGNAWRGDEAYGSFLEGLGDAKTQTNVSGTRDAGAGAWKLKFESDKVMGDSTADGFTATIDYASSAYYRPGLYGAPQTITATRTEDGGLTGTATLPVKVGETDAHGDVRLRTIDSVASNFELRMTGPETFEGTLYKPGDGTDLKITGTTAGDSWRLTVGDAGLKGTGDLSINQAATMAVLLG